MNVRRKGFSLTEIVIVLIIVGILAVVGIGFGSAQITKAKMDSMESNLRIIGSDIENAIVDLGFLESIDDSSYVERYFTAWDNSYVTCRLDLSNIRIVPAGGSFGANYSGVILSTTNYKDYWNNELQIFYMIPTSGDNFRIVIASAGPNSYFVADASNGYVNCVNKVDYGDDIILVMQRR